MPLCAASWTDNLVSAPRRGAVRSAVALLVTLSLVLLHVVPAQAQVGPLERQRISGTDRFATAAALSRAAFPDGTATALIARGDAFPDALAAAGLAGALGAPVLLAERSAIPAATVEELARLGVGTAVLLGGTSALDGRAAQQLRDAGLAVERVAGRTRAGTAAALAREVGADAIGTVNGRRTVFLASETAFPDALAAGPLAYSAQLPILLTHRDHLAPEAAAAVRDLGVEHVVVLGGERAVSQRAVAGLGGGVSIRRVQGSDRTRTAAAIARFALSSLGFDGTRVLLARGEDFPDALAAAAYAGRRKHTLLLSASNARLGRGARDHLLDRSGAVERLVALGGTRALSGLVVDEAERAARGITYVFPIAPAGAASYGRFHHDYPATDIFAACGTTVVSPTVGRVDEVSRADRWDPAVNDGATRGGLSVSIVGDDGVRYYGSHFQSIRSEVKPGARVAAGQTLGTVGRTGSARPTPCHLHFGVSPPCGQGDWQVRRGVVATWPYLDAWKAGDHRPPVREVAAWAQENARSCPGAGS